VRQRAGQRRHPRQVRDADVCGMGVDLRGADFDIDALRFLRRQDDKRIRTLRRIGSQRGTSDQPENECDSEASHNAQTNAKSMLSPRVEHE
jgi:hypothetical protein